jgi:hypothetical protein
VCPQLADDPSTALSQTPDSFRRDPPPCPPKPPRRLQPTGRGSDWPRPDGGGGLPGDWGEGHVLPLCPVLDIRLLGVRDLDFQIKLTETVIHIPIIFMTGHGDIPIFVIRTC